MNAGLENLISEGRLEASLDIDRLPTLDMVRILNEQDHLVAPAVAAVLPAVAEAIDRIAERLRHGGRMIYVGAGTSGRLGALDAAEMPPTFGTDPDLVQALIAGGRRALWETCEGAEDSEEDGARDVASRAAPGDAVVGIAASGRTPYTVGALRQARRLGCLTVAVTNNPGSPLAALAHVAIAPVVGPEVIMGSTRLKAGTAQKMVLNMLSTGVMVKLGKVYSNLMVDMVASNEKLRQRAVRMVALAAGCNPEAAQQALQACGYQARTAIVMLLAQADPEAAAAALHRCGGDIRRAVTALRGEQP